MRESRFEVQALALRADPIDHLPARRDGCKEPVRRAGDREVGSAHAGQRGEVVESVGPHPVAAHIPPHPFGQDPRRLVFRSESQRATREAAQESRQANRRRGQGPPDGPETPRARRAERDHGGEWRRGGDAREPTEPRRPARRVTEPRQGCAVSLLVHPGHEGRRIAQHPVLECPRQRPWLARAVTVMAQVGEPDVEPLGAEEVRQPAAGAVQECAMVREGAVHQQDCRATVAVGAQPVQGQIDAVARGDVARAHS